MSWWSVLVCINSLWAVNSREGTLQPMIRCDQETTKDRRWIHVFQPDLMRCLIYFKGFTDWSEYTNIHGKHASVDVIGWQGPGGSGRGIYEEVWHQSPTVRRLTVCSSLFWWPFLRQITSDIERQYQGCLLLLSKYCVLIISSSPILSTDNYLLYHTRYNWH